MRFLLCGINAKYIHSNLAIFSLKAYADRKKIPGAEIILKEYTINNYVEDILQDLYETKADVVIFSCYIWNISFVRELAAELKKVSPAVKIWAGGPEVSYAANKFLEQNPAFDLIMQGEGEEVFSELIRFALEDKYFASYRESPFGIFPKNQLWKMARVVWRVNRKSSIQVLLL